MSSTRHLVSLAAGLGFVGAGVTLAPTIANGIGKSMEEGRIAAVREELAATPRGAFETRIRDVARIMRPSVVQVTPKKYVRTWNDWGGVMQPAGIGSGVIVSNKGYILTNNHVVRGASAVEVKLADGRVFEAKVLGTDRATDLAVLDIDADGIIPAKLGDSTALEVGDWVLAVGSPFGLEQSVSAGIVSAFGRSGVRVATYEDFIQTDAAVNPGNSGGPLVNLDGEIIGINTAIASRTGAYNGISFAIPTKIAVRVLESIVDTGRVERGWLGFYVRDRGQEGDGAFVESLVPGGPAQRAGIRPGDVILEVDGHAVKDSRSLIFLVADLPAQKAVTLQIARAGSTQKLEAKVESRPEDPAAEVGR
ncbi:MAG: trypsin-like peptidase domain-containing protein [Planctomycetes bacterium]|nr:trypsin-like peptidase domain-containing protein [Planctomycetota bacterium]MCB9919873.1 trypsin-like peptidase domain-containing protein [Planctomycetota bacterium]